MTDIINLAAVRTRRDRDVLAEIASYHYCNELLRLSGRDNDVLLAFIEDNIRFFTDWREAALRGPVHIGDDPPDGVA